MTDALPACSPRSSLVLAPASAFGAEEAVVLTPKPWTRSPRINGARVFGVRPGPPFLFTIAATGERPMVGRRD